MRTCPYWQNADGTGGAERLTKASTDEAHVPESSHGDTLLFANVRGPDVSLWTMSFKDKKPSPFDTVHSVVPTNAVYSPDGKWVAYAARTAQSSTTIYVQPASPDGSKYAISATLPDNPHHPMWRPDGRELFFDPRAGAFQAVAVSSNPTFAFGNAIDLPRPFMSSGDDSRRAFDITPDGQFLGLVEAGTDTRPAFGAQINVILNWFEELKARVPTK
jgi:WD40-like Beta Propeller Repeat